MTSRVVLVVFVTFALFVCQSHGYPKESDDVKEVRIIKSPNEDSAARAAEDIKEPSTKEDTKFNQPSAQKIEEKKPLSSEKDEAQANSSSAGTNLKVRFPEGTHPVMSPNAEDDNVRAKKSPSMREFSYNSNPPHTTTVCIQVRSDHQPQVVCGPQVNEEKKVLKPTPGVPRYAYPSEPPHYSPQQPYMRASPQDLPTSHPSPASGHPAQQMLPSGQQMMPSGQQMLPSGQQMLPSGQPKYVQDSPHPVSPKAAARGPQMLPISRSEEEKPSEGQGRLPVRIIPQGPHPNSVVVHKQYYQPAPYQQGYPSNLIAPSPSPLRFNCALQPEGAHFIQPYESNILRTAIPVLPGYSPMAEQVVTQDGSSARAAQGPQAFDEQAYYYDHARQAQDEIVGSPYVPDYGYSAADPWTGNTYVSEDGQAYYLDESHARAAAEQQMWEREQYLRATGTSSSAMSVEELRTKSNQQEQELRQSKQKLQQLQEQLKDIQQRATVEEEEKKEAKKSHAEKQHVESQKDTKEPAPAHDANPESPEPKKPEAPKANKRQTRKFESS